MRLERGQAQGLPYIHCIAVVRLPLPYPATTGPGRRGASRARWSHIARRRSPVRTAPNGRPTGSPLRRLPVERSIVCTTRVSDWCGGTAVPCPYVCGWIRLQAGQEVRVKLHAFSVHLHADPFVGTVHACQVAAVGL